MITFMEYRDLVDVKDSLTHWESKSAHSLLPKSDTISSHVSNSWVPAANYIRWERRVLVRKFWEEVLHKALHKAPELISFTIGTVNILFHKFHPYRYTPQVSLLYNLASTAAEHGYATVEV
jgi:hypothetical protein